MYFKISLICKHADEKYLILLAPFSCIWNTAGTGYQTLYERCIKSLGFDIRALVIIIMIIVRLLQHKNLYLYVYTL